MLRALGIFLALALASPPADAQVFKPKSKKSAPAKTEKTADKAPAKKAAKKTKNQPRAASTKKRVTAKKKTRADRLAESASAESDKDYVKIWDDDEIE
jgi:hypothetical protein